MTPPTKLPIGKVHESEQARTLGTFTASLDTPSSVSLPSTPVHGLHKDLPACDRCRKFKKKCSRTYPICNLCAHARQPCSFTDPAPRTASLEARQLKARIEWLSRYINKNVPAIQTRVEDIETGSDLVALSSTIPDPDADGDRNHVGSHAAPASAPLRPRPLTETERISLPGNSKTAEPVNFSSDNTCRSLGDDPDARRFVDAYFRNVNRAYPFIDQARIIRDLTGTNSGTTDPSATAISVSTWRRSTDTTLLYLVMAIGCTTLRRAGRHAGAPFEIPYSAIIHECLSHQGTEAVQVLVLLALHSLFDPGAVSTWAIVGLAARQAVLLGLSRRATPSDGLSSTEIELRHRLFWSIYVLDRMMSISFGLPVALRDKNMDVPLPCLTVEEFAAAERPSLSTMLQTSRRVIQLRQIEDRILGCVHTRKNADVAKLPLADRLAIVQEIRRDIEDWHSNGSLITPLETDNIPIHSSISWLNAKYYHLLVLLYYPSRFSTFGLFVSCSDLLRFAQKHIQAIYTLFQHRQLPLNRITLYRIFPIGMVFLYGFMACTDEGLHFPARDELAVLVGILEAFPTADWPQARRTAQHLSQFLSIVSSLPTTIATGASMDVNPASTGFGYFSNAFRPVAHGFLSVMEEVLGKSSCYYVPDLFGRRDPDIGRGALATVTPAVQRAHPTVEMSGGGDAVLVYGGDDAANVSLSNIPMAYTWDSFELDFL